MKTRSERGQSTVLTLVFLTVLLGMAALVLDVGSWYRTKRAEQSTADAAALRFALLEFGQNLPGHGAEIDLAARNLGAIGA